MPDASLPTKEELADALQKYDQAVHDKSVPEPEMDRALNALVSLVPHAFISDLLHWGERARIDEEVIEEALVRERLWHEDGPTALYKHMEEQFVSALQDSSTNLRQRNYCESMLEYIGKEMRLARH